MLQPTLETGKAYACWNLEVDEAIINSLKYSDYVRPESKKQDCLQAYWNTGEANWETVIHAIAEYPIKNFKLAKQIAKKHKIAYTCTIREDTLQLSDLVVILNMYQLPYFF